MSRYIELILTGPCIIRVKAVGRETPEGIADTARDASSSRLIILLLASILALVIVILG